MNFFASFANFTVKELLRQILYRKVCKGTRKDREELRELSTQDWLTKQGHGRRGPSRGHHIQPYSLRSLSLELERPSRTVRDVDDPAWHDRSAIVDSNDHCPPIVQICDLNHCPERQ